MPFDEYKTQVLLLHSEQSTLDNLSSGFSDKYTVHCATSGSEALNTLVETPINVIVSAHDLPGMSGLDALREARKRSPETIGILLAGSKTRDIEALVGDEEVFQVVSGTVTSDGLLTLVENATRQMRMMTLAESANDSSAGDDSAEHIIMETAENGSTIITDGTGQIPALNPRKAASSASRAVDVLVLTKDQSFVETIRDSSRGMHKVHIANTLGKANEAIRKYKVGVAIIDAAMVGNKVEQLNEHLRKSATRLVSIVAGRREDGDMLMDLVNRGKVYRFLLKPVSPGRARLAVESSVKHHLEAPDTAFKVQDAPAAGAPGKPVAKPAPAPQKQAERRTAPPRVDPAISALESSAESSPIDDALASAFGADDKSFTETVTGLISSVGKKISSDKKPPAPKKPPAAKKRPAARKPRTTTGDTGKSGGLVKKAAAASVVLAIIGGGVFFWSQGSDDGANVAVEKPASVPSVAEADFEPTATVDNSAANEALELADEARAARDRGNIFSPEGYNAIELFAASLAADPDSSLVARELEAMIGQAVTMAELAMLESDFDNAGKALRQVAAADPENERLPFLTAQLSQMQLRSELDAARVAIREGRFEDAGFALDVARDLAGEDSSEVDALATELQSARGEQRVDEVLAKATARMESGDLLTPSNDNARYYYQLVLTSDTDNAAARQGLAVIASKLAFQARTEIDNGDLTLAADTIKNARALDTDSEEVAAAATALANRIEEIAEAERIAEELLAQQAAAERRAEAERQAEARRLADEQAAASAATLAAAQNPPAQTSSQTFAQNDVQSSTQGSEPRNVAAEMLSALQRSPQPDIRDQEPVSVSKLNRIKYAAPKYPRSAQRRNLTGWVDVVFTVRTDGTVGDIEVRNSEPGDTFVNSATKAVEKWEFEPVTENGFAIEKRAGVRLMFALE